MPSAPRRVTPQASVWLNDRTGTRRKRTEQPAGLDRGKIVKAAIRLLDAGGLARFSMRRLAAELGVTPMSLYWYVDNKEDLLEIALDEVNGTIPLPDRAAAEADWRAALLTLATGYRRMLVEHPWVSRLMGEYLNVGPRSMAFSTAAYRVVRGADLPAELIYGALAAVFQFVHGFGTQEGRWAERCRAAGVGEDDLYRDIVQAVRHRPYTEGLAELVHQRSASPLAQLRERDFAVALDCLLAGIEAIRPAAGGIA